MSAITLLVHPQLHEPIFDFLSTKQCAAVRCVSKALSRRIIDCFVERVSEALHFVRSPLLPYRMRTHTRIFAEVTDGPKHRAPAISSSKLRCLMAAMPPIEFQTRVADQIRTLCVDRFSSSSRPVFQPLLEHLTKCEIGSSRGKPEDLVVLDLADCGADLTDSHLRALVPRCKSLAVFHVPPGKSLTASSVMAIVKAAGPSLRHVDFGKFRGSGVGDIVEAIAEFCPNVESLGVEGSQGFTDDLLACVLQRCRLKYCFIGHSATTDTGILHVIEKCDDLEYLSLSPHVRSPESKPPPAICKRRLLKVKTLDFLFYGFRDPVGIPLLLRCFPNLENLIFRQPDFIDDILLAAVDACPGVSSLALPRTDISVSVFPAMKRWNIRHVSLSVGRSVDNGTRSEGDVEEWPLGDLLAVIGAKLESLSLENDKLLSMDDCRVIALHCPCLELLISAAPLEPELKAILKGGCPQLQCGCRMRKSKREKR